MNHGGAVSAGRRWLALLVAGVAAALLGTGLVSGVGRAATPASPPHRVIDIQARQWAFSPGVITVQKGDVVTLRLTSRDVTHGIYIDGYGIERAIPVGPPVDVTFTADKPGRFMFRCAITCGAFHPYMIGWLNVQPNVTAYAGWTVIAATVSGVVGVLVKVGWVL